MEKIINGLKVKMNIPEDKVFCGFYIVNNKDGSYTIFGQCDKSINMATTDGYELVDVFSEVNKSICEHDKIRGPDGLYFCGKCGISLSSED